MPVDWYREAVDETRSTAETYEEHADAYREKYRAASVAARHGDAFFDALAGDRVLDVGCGPGSDAVVFADRGYDVVGADVTQSFLQTAREDVDGAFCRADMRSLPFATGSFDGVWSSAALHHVPKADARAALAEFERVLREDGALFCSVKRGEGAGFEPDPDHGDGDDRFFAYYGGEEFEAMLEAAGFAGEVTAEGRWVSALANPR
jgi:ubiquinone/menaquinone biosynthesis C-methylase UbiE